MNDHPDLSGLRLAQEQIDREVAKGDTNYAAGLKLASMILHNAIVYKERLPASPDGCIVDILNALDRQIAMLQAEFERHIGTDDPYAGLMAGEDCDLLKQARAMLAASTDIDLAQCKSICADLAVEAGKLRLDVNRYRWLREQDWFSDTLAVVRHPKRSVKLGHDCPCRDRLDAAIDAEMRNGK